MFLQFNQSGRPVTAARSLCGVESEDFSQVVDVGSKQFRPCVSTPVRRDLTDATKEMMLDTSTRVQHRTHVPLMSGSGTLPPDFLVESSVSDMDLSHSVDLSEMRSHRLGADTSQGRKFRPSTAPMRGKGAACVISGQVSYQTQACSGNIQLLSSAFSCWS